MSLIIRGVNLPEKCENCPCYDYIDYVCRADDCFAPFDVENPEERSEYCPLIEIRTPHGRLIDADELEKCVHEWYGVGEYVFADTIRNADTIIEAENSSAIDDDVKKYCDYLKSETYDFCNRIENGEVSE